MKVEKVWLENIKSYGDGWTEVSLGSGVNAILGENGTGKSTILEAVGYALFDYLNPYTQDDFLRDGADRGRIRVEVAFTDGSFTVERHVGESTYKVLESGQEIATQKKNVLPWIRDRLDIPDSLDLDTLWSTCIGVPQGRITADFVKPPKERKAAFDPVLQTAAYVDAWENMRDVEKVIEKQISEKEKEIEGLKVAAGDLEEKLEEKRTAEEDLQNLKDSKAELEKELSRLKEKREDLEGVKEEIEGLESKLENVGSKVESAEESLQGAKNLREEAEKAKSILKEVKGEHQEYKAKEAEKGNLEEKLEEREDIKDALSSVEEKLAQLEAKEDSLQTAADEARKAKKKMKELKEEVSKQGDIEEKISELKAKVERLDEIIQLLKDAKEAECPTCNQALPETERTKVMNAHKEERSSLEREISSLEDELESLGSPQDKMERAKARYQDNKDAGEHLSKLREEISSRKKEKEELESSLEEYENLKERKSSLKQRLEELKEPHLKFVRNEDLASKLPERKKKVEQAQKKLNELRSEKEEVKSKLNERKSSFDEEKYEEVSSRIEEVSSRVSMLRARIEEREDRLAELKETVKEKRRAREELEKKKDEKVNLEKDLEFTGFVREGIQRARPLVTEVLVQEVSETASRIFRQLRGESQALKWTKDYQIIVRSAEGEKAFHKLSGGEQVCAALAVRLAILQRLAPVSFAFLDEPTESLDGVRKENLASRLEGFRALNQLSVISHDRVFEGMAEQVVSLRKTDEGTEVK